MRITLVNADLPSATPVPPLGLVSIAHAATVAGHPATIRDYQLASGHAFRLPETFAAFSRSSDQVLGVSTSGMSLPLVLLSLQRLKAERPELVTVLGGIGAAGAAVGIIREFPWIDFVAVGEAEECLPNLLACLEKGVDPLTVPGFVCRHGGQPQVNPACPRIRDLDRIQAPVWEYIDLSRYALINIATARGCPFPCTFCDVAPFWEHRHTARSVEGVLAEIRAISSSTEARPTFVFVDDTLTISRRRVEALCDGLEAIEGGVAWACYARANALDESLLTRMASSGCRKIYLGLESGSDRVLTAIRKGFDVETGRRAAVLARRHVPIVQTSFVWGFPFESWTDFYDTLLLMGYLVTEDVSVKANVLTPLPFSALFGKYSDSLVFLPGYSPWLHFAGYESHDEVVDVIRRYPHLFPTFYLYQSETLTQKYDLLRKMGLAPEDIWDLWEQARGPVPVREIATTDPSRT